jgi:hypothetical protein
MSARHVLGRVRAPDEQGAEERAWTVVRSAYEARQPIAQRASRRSFAVAFAAALTIGAVAFSPAGATVGRLITRALGVQHAARALSSLPTSGRLLVSGPAGTWTVQADGAIRRLGAWPQASWSPHGRYVAVAGEDQLAALDPRGASQWTLSRPSVSDPRWYSPSGYRIAYLSAGELRVVAGDGSGDHLVDSGVAGVAPAWRPGHAYQLAYMTNRGALVLRDGDSRRLRWRAVALAGVTKLQWSSDGTYLLAISRARARIYSADGELARSVAAPAGSFLLDGALSPDGRLLALVLGGADSGVVLEGTFADGASPRRVLAGQELGQLLWSPDGEWLLVSWPAADEWVFVRVEGKPRIAAVSNIAKQFGRGSRGFPQLAGWCCTAR